MARASASGTSAPMTRLPRRGRSRCPRRSLGNGGQVTIRKSGNGITYWSTENSWYSADRKTFQQGQLALNITRDYYLLQKRQDKPTDPITYDLVPLNGPVHIGDIIAVRLALGGTNWKYLLAEDPIPAGTEFLPESGPLHHQPQAGLVGRLVYARGIPRRPRRIFQHAIFQRTASTFTC